MENNDLKGDGSVSKEEFVIEQERVSNPIDEQTLKQNLTNEQKLVYLSKLIQDIEQKIESSDIRKKLIK